MADQKTIKRIQEIGSEFLGWQVVRLGNYEEIVESGTPGRYFARQYNGDVIEVVNTARASPRFDLHVLVRRTKTQPNVWKIIEVLEDYTDPAEEGELGYHHKQHEEDGPDRLALHRKQIKQLSCRVSGTWAVRVYGATIITPNGVQVVNTKTINLASYVVTIGAKFVTIQTDEDGALSVVDGTPFGSPGIATRANIPLPSADHFMIAYILLYEGQTALQDKDIQVPIPLAGGAGGAGGVEEAPNDGEIYGRRNEAWEIIPETINTVAKLVMEPGLSSPPVPVENVDGTDWVYYEE